MFFGRNSTSQDADASAKPSRGGIRSRLDLVYFALGAAILTFLIAHNVRSTISVVIVAVISMTLQTPLTWVSAYMVFFITKENRVITTLTGIGLALGTTIALAVSLFFYRWTFDYPEFRVPMMAVTVFGGMFLSRILVLGPLGVLGCIAALFTPLLALGQLILHIMCIVKGINGQRLMIPGLSDFANKF